jgi:hypothetical protein
MLRRDALRMFASGAVLPVLSPDLFAMFREAQPGSGYALRSLNPHQNATVVAMIDQIIPATDTPGAKGARVNEFIDVILTEWATDEERNKFIAGLADVDKKSNELFSKDFVDAAPAQQFALLSSLDDTAGFEAARMHHGSVPPEQRDSQMKGSFWPVFKNITVHGYYTSEIGFSQELKLQIIPGALHGCVPVVEEKKA